MRPSITERKSFAFPGRPSPLSRLRRPLKKQAAQPQEKWRVVSEKRSFSARRNRNLSLDRSSVRCTPPLLAERKSFAFPARSPIMTGGYAALFIPNIKINSRLLLHGGDASPASYFSDGSIETDPLRCLG